MPAINSKSGAWHKRFSGFLHLSQRNRLVLLTIACVSSVFFSDTLAEPSHTTYTALLAYLVILLLLFCSSRRIFLLFLLLSLLCGTLHYWRLQREIRLHQRLQEKQIHEGVFSIISLPKLSNSRWSAFADFEGKKWEVSGRYPAPRIGDTLKANAMIEKWEAPRNEGEFDRALWLKRNGAIASARLVQVMNQPDNSNRVMRTLDDMRLGLRQAITAGIAENADEAVVIRAMVLGEQPARDDELLKPFIHSGTMHLFSVSGQHVNLVAVILWVGMRLLRIPRKCAILLLIPAIFLYAYVTGASPPAIRAAWMAAVFLSAFWFQRKPYLLGALSIVMCTALFLDSHLIFLPGVQLSYGVVAAISIGLSLCHHRIQRWSLMDDYLPRELYTPWQERLVKWKQDSAQSLAVSTSACLGSAPLGILHFGMFTPISIVANIVMTPFVAALLALAIISSAIYPVFPGVAAQVNQINVLAARSCIGISQFCAKIPGASWQYSIHRAKDDTIRIFDLPRGNGATMFQLNDADVLLDTGSKHDARTMSSCLQYFAATPELLILSHPESGHIGYAADLISAFELKEIISPVAESRASSFRNLLVETNQRQISIRVAKPFTFDLSDRVSCQLIPTPGCADKRLIADDRVCLQLIDFHGFNILFAHDISPAELEALWPTLPTPIDVLVLGRHELYTRPIDSWPNHQPRVIIASHADFPTEEIIPESWCRHVESQGIQVLCQKQTGMVSIHVDENQQLCLKGHLSGSINLSRLLPK